MIHRLNHCSKRFICTTITMSIKLVVKRETSTALERRLKEGQFIGCLSFKAHYGELQRME